MSHRVSTFLEGHDVDIILVAVVLLLVARIVVVALRRLLFNLLGAFEVYFLLLVFEEALE